MITDLMDFIGNFIDFPPEFEFIGYLAAAVLLLFLFVITLDFFASVSFAIFRRR